MHNHIVFKGFYAFWLIALYTFGPTLNHALAQEPVTYIEALELEKTGDDKAWQQFALIAVSNESLANHASYQVLFRAYEQGDFEQITALAPDHLARFGPWRLSGEVRLMLAESFCELRRFSEAQTQVEAFLVDEPDQQETRAYALLGQALAGQGKATQAQRYLGEAVYIHGYGSWKNRAESQAREIEQSARIPKMAPSRNLMRQKIDEAFANGHFITCQRLCDRYVRLYPGGNGWKMRIKAVDCLLERRKRNDARDRLKAIESSMPEIKEATAAMQLRWARAEQGRGFRGKARTSYWEVMQKYPHTEAGILARYFTGYYKYDAFSFDEAAAQFEPFLEKWNHPWLRDEALWKAGFSRYLCGEYNKAIAHFNDFMKEFPDHKDRDRAMYWRARTLVQMGEKDKGIADFQWVASHYVGTYYGLAAQIHLEVAGGPNYIATEAVLEKLPWEHLLPFMPIPRLDHRWAQLRGGGPEMDEGTAAVLEVMAREADLRIRRSVMDFLAFYHGGRLDLAYKEADHIYTWKMDVPYAGYITGIMFALCHANLKAILAANKTAAAVREGDLFDPHRLNARRQFPLLFEELINKTAATHDVDFWLAMGLVKQESAFQVEARSWVGAAGLFQVMPNTGKWIALKRGIKKFKTTDLYDPETSADFGIWYFKRLLDNNDNDVPKSLAGYNAGGLRADRWWGENPGRAYDEMIELIGFEETRNYVKIILRNWEMYQRLYVSPGTADFSRESIFLLLLDQVPRPMDK